MTDNYLLLAEKTLVISVDSMYLCFFGVCVKNCFFCFVSFFLLLDITKLFLPYNHINGVCVWFEIFQFNSIEFVHRKVVYTCVSWTKKKMKWNEEKEKFSHHLDSFFSTFFQIYTIFSRKCHHQKKQDKNTKSTFNQFSSMSK